MSFMEKLRYKRGRWAARRRAFGSTIDNDAVRMVVFQPESGSGILAQEAAANAISPDAEASGRSERKRDAHIPEH